MLVTGIVTVWVNMPVKYCMYVLAAVRTVVEEAVAVVVYPGINVFPFTLPVTFKKASVPISVMLFWNPSKVMA